MTTADDKFTDLRRLTAKKRSLNDQILEFLQPAPKEVDPEADLVPAVAQENIDVEGTVAETTGSGRLLLRPEISLGTKYAGKKTSRRALVEDEDSQSDSSDVPGDEGSDDGAEESEEAEDEDGQSLENSESADSEESQSSNALMRPRTLDEADKLQSELNQILAQESTPLVDLTPSKKELTKAKHARNQRILYSDFLEMRIRLQKSVNIANRLPHPVEHRLFSSKNADISTRFAEVSASIRELIGDLCEMQSELIQQNPTMSAGEDLKKSSQAENDATQLPAVAAAPRKRLRSDLPADKLWTSIVAVQQGVEKQADPVLDKWNAKVHLTAGLANKKFKALNTSIVSQLHQTLETESERLVTRTQQKRNQYRVLGSPAPTEATKTDQAKGAKRTAAAPEYDDQIFDDTDFYQQLLKDLLDSSIDEKDPTALTKKWLANKNATTKQHRPNVDRKASKGRKIKYVVHEKLVNFMTPVPLERPAMADELFQKLFQS